MPRYKNETGSNVTISSFVGYTQTLPDGGTADTSKYYDIVGLTKVSDEPFINPIAAYHNEDFTDTTARTIVLTSPNIAKVRIQKADGTYDIFLQAETNVPAVLEDWTSEDYPVDLVIDGLCTQLIIVPKTSTGSIQLVELKKR